MGAARRTGLRVPRVIGPTKPSVLLVDDDPTVSAMFGLGLAAAGFAVTDAASARAALGAIEHDLPDVIVLDWQMPGMRGDELLDVLRQNKETSDVRVLFLSNFPRDDPHVAGAVVAGSPIVWLVKSQNTVRAAGVVAGSGRTVFT